jgi:hypothetical protein
VDAAALLDTIEWVAHRDGRDALREDESGSE